MKDGPSPMNVVFLNVWIEKTLFPKYVCILSSMNVWSEISHKSKLNSNINRSGFWPVQIENKFNLGHGNGIMTHLLDIEAAECIGRGGKYPNWKNYDISTMQLIQKALFV